MSGYLGRMDRPEYRRDYDEGERDRDRAREKDRGRRQGEGTRDSLGSRDRILRSPKALRRSQSPPRARSVHKLPSGISHPISPSSQDSRTPISASPRSPFAFPSKPILTNSQPVSDTNPSTSASVANRPETRDPRLLNRINTSNSVVTGNISRASIAESPTMPDSAIYITTDCRNNLASPSVVQTTGQNLPINPRNRSPLTPKTAIEKHGDPATLLAPLLGSLLDNASDAAALKYEHSKVQAKATHQANLDRKMGDLSKTYPAFAEFSIKAKNNIDKDLALLDQKLSKHQKAQGDHLSTVPDLLRVSTTPTTREKEREQMDMVRRCISIYEDFKFSVEDLKKDFEKHKLLASKVEEVHESMDTKVNASASQVRDLSSLMTSVQDRCSRLDEKHDRLRDVTKSSRSELTSGLAELKIHIKHYTEHVEQEKAALDAAADRADRADKASQRLGLLETKCETFSKSDSLHAKKAEELEKLVDNHSSELQHLVATASHNKNSGDALKLINQEIQDLRQILSDIQKKGVSVPPEMEELSAVKREISALRADFLELKNDKAGFQDPSRSGQTPSRNLPHIDNGVNNCNQTHLTDLESRLKGCLEDIGKIHERLKEKQEEEEKRDDVVAAQVEEVRASNVKEREENGRRIGNLESHFQKQKAADLNKMQKLQVAVSQLIRNGHQKSTSRVSPPSAPPTPQMQQIRQPQATSSSPQLSTSAFETETNRRLESSETLQAETMQQMQACTIACRQLDQRYNNLSTEPIVRAMVHQMQLMYPYASEAQREIFNLKQIVEPLRTIPVQLESLRRVADNHDGKFAELEARIGTLDKEETKNEAKQDKLVAHFKEEHGKLVDEVKSQKETVDGLGERLGRLEGYCNSDPDRLECRTEHLGGKWHAESEKAIEGITRRLTALEADRGRQDLLEAFTRKVPADKTADKIRETHDDDSDESTIHLAVKTNGVESKNSPSAPSKTFFKSKTASKLRKRKRKSNDRSDDDTYTPKTQSSPPRRKYRG